MHEITGNLWDPVTWKLNGQRLDFLFDAICITTNGAIKKNGEAVMGRGCAKEAVDKWHAFNLPALLGKKIRTGGNHTQILIDHRRNPIPYSLISFPVKHDVVLCKQDKSNVLMHMRNQSKPGSLVPGWASYSDPKLIIQSARELMTLMTTENLGSVILPRPGCGNGGLEWEDVRKSIREILDDRVCVISFR